MQVVEVRWGDAWVDTDDFTLEEAKKLKPIVRSTIGFLIKESSDSIVLCTDLYEKDKKTQSKAIRYLKQFKPFNRSGREMTQEEAFGLIEILFSVSRSSLTETIIFIISV